MEHQVFVPVPAERLRTALADQARVARAVPGLQQEAGAEPLTGRLRLRVGGHSVTYRGTARVSAREDGTYAVDGDATESRGTGAVKLALTLTLTDTGDGCTVTAEGGAEASGRITELPAETVTAAAARLLTRFLEALAADDEERAERTEETGAAGTPARAVHADRLSDRLADDFADTGEPPAEAAHARRTMIGRSAEEVDHAPPRGRYAPVPAPQTVTGNPVVRWAAPAAALALASAIVVTRALRKRR
ncbi:SRPBCC family protein [Streptomyces capoamus]|uniref:SRPBCC family protein n=1 Tax=Streptomyces capoamus TaxID=68183 RepID=UPI003C30BB47